MRLRPNIKAVLLAGVAALVAGVLATACGGAASSDSPQPTGPIAGQARAETGAPQDEIAKAQDTQPPDSSLDESGDTSSRETAAVSQLPNSSKDVEVDFWFFNQLLRRDAIRPIYEPEFIPGELESLDPRELVMGVEINGEARAYPVGLLNGREMVNDVVGGVPILVTW